MKILNCFPHLTSALASAAANWPRLD